MRGPATPTWRRAVLLLVGLVALITTSLPGLASAAEEEGGKNLSVPAIYIGSGGPATWAPCGAAVAPTGDTSTHPDAFLLPLTGVTPGEYYLQGEDLWQASCMLGTSGLAVDPAWGDNLTGAPLKVGTPIRIEIGLLPNDMTPYASMTGYDVVKLTDELDRVATYGTLGMPETPYPEVRVWAADATYSVQSVDGAYLVPAGTPFGAEINSTGRIVYGAQLTVMKAGTYVLTFSSPNVVFDDGDGTTTISITVNASSGGGGGGGGRPDNPGGGQGGGGGRLDNPGAGQAGSSGPRGPR